MSQLQEYIEKHREESQRLIGVHYERLHQLIAQAEKVHYRQQQSKMRLIKGGGGRQPQLSVVDQILLTLVYLHHCPTFQMLGVQFGVSESTANSIFHYWVKILRELLPASLIDQVKKKKNSGSGFPQY